MYIVFEGVDGAGTSTHAKLLADTLSLCTPYDYNPTFRLAEPSANPIGRLLREELKGEADPISTALLFAADRSRYHTQYNYDMPDVFFVSDRSKYSSFAYQLLDLPETVGPYDAFTWLQIINCGAPEPDLIIFLDASPSVIKDRISRRTNKDRYDHRTQEVQQSYSRVFQGMGNVVKVDTSRPTDVVAGIIHTIARTSYAEILRGIRR